MVFVTVIKTGDSIVVVGGGGTRSGMRNRKEGKASYRSSWNSHLS